MNNLCAVVVVISQPVVQIVLQLFNRVVDLAPERDLIKLLQNGFMKALADSISLRMSNFRLGVLNVIEGQVELLIMRFRPAAIFGATVGQHAAQAHFLLSQERQHPVVQ